MDDTKPLARIVNKLEDLTKKSGNVQFKYEWKDKKYFLVAFYHHHIAYQPKKAKSLYKKAIRRSECSRGSFNMLLCNPIQHNSYFSSSLVYLREQRSLSSSQKDR